jgi:phosphatidylserine decarboxylase
MRVRKEVLPPLGILVALSVTAGIILNSIWLVLLVLIPGTACICFFFRDPDRTPPNDTSAIVSGADGRVMSVRLLAEHMYLNAECVRISVFLSIFDAHVNRAPLSGAATFIGYFPGIRAFAFREKASELNQHNKILIEGAETRCLVNQIVGPVAYRVVYWLNHASPTVVRAGDRIGMMKFGSRLDIYLPTSEVGVLVKPGDRVRAGETVIARIKPVRSTGDR